MRPSYEAMLAIERQTGKTLLQLASGVALGRSGGVSLGDAAIIVTEGIKAAGKDRDDPMKRAISRDRIGEMIYSSGYLKALGAIEDFLVNALNGGHVPDEKKTGEATTE